MTVDCLLHVHSSFSYDSRTDLAEVAALARLHRRQCVLMTEHNNTLDQSKVDALVARCAALSDASLLIVPGLELAFDSNRVHLLAFGITRFISSVDPGCTFRSLIDEIHRSGGLAVLAHPSHRQALERVSTEDLSRLDGIEVWNVKNGNRFCPDAGELKALGRTRATSSTVWAFAGLDLHHPRQFATLTTRIETERLTADAVLTELRCGRFTINGPLATIGPDGTVGALRLVAFGLVANGLKRSRASAYRCQRWIERKGFKTPRAIAAIGRRLF